MQQIHLVLTSIVFFAHQMSSKNNNKRPPEDNWTTSTATPVSKKKKAASLSPSSSSSLSTPLPAQRQSFAAKPLTREGWDAAFQRGISDESASQEAYEKARNAFDETEASQLLRPQASILKKVNSGDESMLAAAASLFRHTSLAAPGARHLGKEMAVAPNKERSNIVLATVAADTQMMLVQLYAQLIYSGLVSTSSTAANVTMAPASSSPASSSTAVFKESTMMHNCQKNMQRELMFNLLAYFERNQASFATFVRVKPWFAPGVPVEEVASTVANAPDDAPKAILNLAKSTFEKMKQKMKVQLFGGEAPGEKTHRFPDKNNEPFFNDLKNPAFLQTQTTRAWGLRLNGKLPTDDDEVGRS